MKNYLIAVFVCLGLFKSIAQGFCGNIEFKFATEKDTTTNLYWVKDKQVKLDQYAKKGGAVEGSYLFDLNNGEIRFLSPKRKLWGTQKSETPQVLKGTCVVSKGNGSKKICGIKCTDYVVKNAEENLIITYWITEGGKFNFFVPLIKSWNRKYKQSVYFTQIKNLPEGSMPLLSEERQISDNKLLTKLEATKVDPKPLENSVFEIPSGYTKFDK